MESSPLVSIIVNNFKGTDKLQVCLSSIKKTDYQNFEIIVCDCITTDISSWIKENFPEVKLVHFDKDVGPAASRNAGLSITNQKAKYDVFVDNDTKMHPQWLRNLVNSLESDPEIGAAQPLLMKMNSHKEVDSYGGFFDRIGYACLPPFLDNRLNLNIESFDICYCEGITILRRCVLDNFNNANEPYDPDYFQHWEDIDFCWRIMLSGYKVVLVPSSVVFHERGVSAGLGKQSANLVFLNTRNRTTTLLKNYSLRNLIQYLPLLVLFEFFKGVLLIRTNKSHVIPTFEGLSWNLKNIGAIWKKRVQVQHNIRKVNDSGVANVLVNPCLIRLFRDFQRHYPSENNNVFIIK